MAAAQLGNEFVHSSFGLPPNVPLPTFPEPGLGAMLALELPWFELRVGAYDGAPDGRTSGFDTTFDQRGGTLVIGQATLNTSAFIKAVRVGYLLVGGWYHSGDVDGSVARNTYGFYGIVEQPLWVSGKHRLALLGQVSWASKPAGGVRTYACTTHRARSAGRWSA